MPRKESGEPYYRLTLDEAAEMYEDLKKKVENMMTYIWEMIYKKTKLKSINIKYFAAS